MMAAEWWWFLVLNAIVAAIAVLSSRARPPLTSASPRHGAGITRRASSAVMQRLRSFSMFSFPSGNFHTAPFVHPDATTAGVTSSRETEQPAEAAPTKQSPPVLALSAPPAAEAAATAGLGEDEGPDAMSMEEAYALVLAARQQSEPEKEVEAMRSDVDAKAEEFIRGFKEDLRQQRLNSIFNNTEMLGAGGREPAARPDHL